MASVFDFFVIYFSQDLHRLLVDPRNQFGGFRWTFGFIVVILHEIKKNWTT